MPRNPLFSLSLAALLLAPAAHAEGFTATLGYQNTDPKSDNGTLAGADASIDDDWSVTGSAAWAFTDNWSVEFWTGLSKFEHDVSLEGLGTIARVSHLPRTLSVNYHFLPERAFRPFVGVGYGWISISDERALGALSGLDVDGDFSRGISFTLGADYYFNERFFLRADVRKLDFDTDISVETLGEVGTAEVDPLVYGLSAGLRF